MRISVNILCMNNLDVMRHSIPSIIEELTGTEYEIIVVDNGSTDSVGAFLPPMVKYIRNDENRGISIGKNQGINASSGEYIFMIDGDVLPVKNSILKLAEWLDANPDKDAIGMYPNRFTTDMNHGHFNPAEAFCHILFEPVPHKCACLFYGMYRRRIFDNGLRMDESGEYGKPGYGWEDHDFFKRMQTLGITQYVTNINHAKGRYHHRINSSIRVMGDSFFRESIAARSKQFKRTWENAA